MHHDNASPTVRFCVTIFLAGLQSNEFKQSKAIYLYFFNSALGIYLRTSFYTADKLNYHC